MHSSNLIELNQSKINGQYDKLLFTNIIQIFNSTQMNQKLNTIETIDNYNLNLV